MGPSLPSPELLEYLARIARLGLLECAPPPKAVLQNESVTTFVLHRAGQFQVELVLMHPGAAPWPGEHRHPNVETVEIEWFACHGFTKNGRVVTAPDFALRGRSCVYLAPTDFHGTPLMREGAALLSVQRWLNGVPPSSVGLDWDGAPVSPGHAKQWQEFRQ